MSAATDLVTPATLLDLAELAGGALPFAHWAFLRAQVTLGPSWVLRAADGAAIAAAGLARLPNGAWCHEVWFLPGPDAGRHLRTIVRATRLTLSQGDYGPILAAIQTAEGARLASLVGFEKVDGVPRVQGGEVWQWAR